MKAVLFALLIFVLAAAANAQAPDLSALSKTPGGQRVINYFAAFNSGDENKLSSFFSENISADALKQRPVEPRVAFHRQVRNDFGKVDITKVVSVGDSEIKVIGRSVNGALISYLFTFEDQPAKKFTSFGIQPIEESPVAEKPAVKYSAPATRSEFLKVVELFMDDQAKADAFSGVVMVANGDKAIFSKAYGEANSEKQVPNNIDTKFNLGSINKMFTRIAIGQLVKQGKLSFSDKLNKILPDYPNKEVAAKITIGQIVTMTSGLGDFFNDKFIGADKSKIRSLQDYLPFFVNEPLEFEPGTKNRYSNAGYLVLGLVIEKLTGKSYYDYVRQNIFKPAGMNDTDSFAMNELPTNTALGYQRTGTLRRRNDTVLPGRGSSAGGGYSTVADMLKFSNALRSKKLEMPADDGTFPTEFKGAGFAGGSEGVNALFIANGQTGYTIVVLSNYDPPSAEKPGSQIRDWLKQVKD